MKLVMAICRAAAIIGIVSVVVVGATLAFDANAPHGILQANEVSAASADLQIKTDNTSFGATAPGFKFNSMIPGQTTAGFNVTLHNAGLVALVVTANIPTNLAGSTLPPSKVSIRFNNITDGGNNEATVDFLNTNNFPLQNGTLAPGATKTFELRITMSDTLTGNGPFSLTPFDLVFVGTQP